MNTLEIELAVAGYFDFRANTIVPNISWGLNLHEIDVLVLTKSGYAYEVEIKTTKADLVRDSKKKHGHRSSRIKRLYFAVPESLAQIALTIIPIGAGLLTIKEEGGFTRAKLIKPPSQNSQVRPLNPDERLKLHELATMRLWNMKRILLSRLQEIQRLHKICDNAGIA